MSATYCLQITEANHDEDQFFTLGGAGWDSAHDRQVAIDSIPRLEHDCEDPTVRRCYIVDVLDPVDQFTIDDNFEIDEATAHTLLGVEDFEPLRERERAAFAAVEAVTA
ncbi:hypothetical protein GCM10009718_32900 [Isoptericola halotolerans]|uniref:Uncharacterized protein n=1 Tax=Isoptericola halotolerans TaxID=300560 RepID=A0ABX2A8C4_9MICO|nr:hypothetical protein [Isoptericola halotolerans]NOV98178.1 hypothetical protein [Isoptericola halotolerans]